MAKTISEKIYQYVHELCYAGVDADLAEKFGEYLLTLASLTDRIDAYCKKDADGNLPKLGKTQIRELQAEYNKVIDSGTDFIEEAYDDSHKKAIRYVIGQINNTLAKELVELSNVLNTSETTMNEVFEKTNRVQLDVTGQNIAVEGGQQSARMPITYVNKNGKEVSGYFTENTVFDSKRDHDALFQRCAGDNPRYMQAFQAIYNNKTIQERFKRGSHSNAYKNRQAKVYETNELRGVFAAELKLLADQGVDVDELNNDPEFSVRMFQFLSGMSANRTKSGILNWNAGVSEGSVLEERNAAMTAMADLLGVPDLLARSVKMQVKNGDRVMSGVFMEKALGTDIAKVTYDDELSEITDKNIRGRISNNAKKQLSDLQVLDFICGNVDRHNGNMMYITKRNGDGNVVIDGVQGIDNDCSFGVIDAEDQINGINQLKGLAYLERMSSDMANHIMVLTPEILRTTLRPFHLKQEQVEACINRVKMVQAQITRSTVYNPDFKIINNNQWSRVPIDITEDTYLAGVADRLPDSIRGTLRSIDQKRVLNEKLRKLDARLAPSGEVAHGNAEEIDPILETERTKSETFKHLKNTLEDVKKGAFIGSKAFDRVKDAFEELSQLDIESIKKQSPKQMKELMKKYENLTKVIDRYLDKKEKEKKELLLKGKSPSKYAIARTSYAQELKEFAQKRMDMLKTQLPKRGQLIAQAEQKLDGNIHVAKAMAKQAMNEANADPKKEVLKDGFLKDMEIVIHNNQTLKNSLQEHKEELTVKHLDEMVSPLNQERMLESVKKTSEKQSTDVSKEVSKEASKEAVSEMEQASKKSAPINPLK